MDKTIKITGTVSDGIVLEWTKGRSDARLLMRSELHSEWHGRYINSTIAEQLIAALRERFPVSK